MRKNGFYSLAVIFLMVFSQFIFANENNDTIKVQTDTIANQNITNPEITSDSLCLDNRFTRLTDDDYSRVAKQLGIEVATIKAVSDIEAGRSHKGFLSPGIPIINFDTRIFKSRLTKAGHKVASCCKKAPIAFASVKTKKYGSYGEAQYARLNDAMKIDSIIAKESTFWGMFQIGGFNWQRCGAESIDDFTAKMSESEAMQLQLFACFLQNSGMVKYLKQKNWKRFAITYNGKGAIKNGYHTRLARGYAKYSKQ